MSGLPKTCEVEDCDKLVKSNPRFCKAHYMRWYRYGDPLAGARFRNTTPPELCTINNCGKEHHALGFCAMHYYRLRENGDVDVVKTRHEVIWKPRIIDEKSVAIPLTRGFEAVVDIEDLESLRPYNWYVVGDIGKQMRAQATIDGFAVFMHKFITKTSSEQEVDHKDRDSLNNRRGNLRIVTHTVNMRNTERHLNRVGISFNKRAKQWVAYINEPDKRTRHLGYTKTREEAERLLQNAKDAGPITGLDL